MKMIQKIVFERRDFEEMLRDYLEKRERRDVKQTRITILRTDTVAIEKGQDDLNFLIVSGVEKEFDFSKR